ncbi:MAG: translation initiation factor IF-2, partial [Defluviicoccus sp.]|nr:translation initiation factor IF-2 [Defluviicoccus sp.]
LEAERAAAAEAAAKAATQAKPEPESPARPAAKAADTQAEEAETERPRGRKSGRQDQRRLAPKRGEPRRRAGRLTIAQALDDEERQRSLASLRRLREREKRAQRRSDEPIAKVVRDVVVPETITVQELASRMAQRAPDVIKTLMGMGIMATINQSLDADTAELVVGEYGHKVKRVSDADVEIGIRGEDDTDTELVPRPPVVTVMGHVDHGKTSLLDALRKSDVAAGEAGGITQHIGAYQATLAAGDQRITFIDTPGHAAFTAMRARGANVTDIVILVVAADDGVMPQTVEAIDHARAAEVPIIVAVNKIDRPDADPTRVRNELLQHELVVEEFGGDVLSVDVSAVEGTNLDKLLETVVLQAEVLELRANPERSADGVVIESKLERGRGSVATLLIQRGTLRTGDIVVAGSEWGRVRAIFDDGGEQATSAGPSVPVEILGLNGTPAAGDEFSVVENEMRAREITEFRVRRERDARAAMAARGSVEQMFSNIGREQKKEFALVIKADVQGSVEAIQANAESFSTDEVGVRVLHAGVGGINESDVTLASASDAVIIGFNVRAGPQARQLATQDSVEIRYYSVIYDVLDDIKAVLTGMLAPIAREHFLGNAEILQVFNISKLGRVAGCRVSEGLVRRGSRVRLLRDNVVVHEGTLSSLRRFKDEVREVRDGFECGMAFENYQDLKERDVIECFDVEEVARTL